MIRHLVRGRPALAQLVRYGVVGGGCAALYAGLASSLTALGGVSPILSSIVAYGLAGIASYLGQKLFTFRSDAPHADAAPRFFVVFLVGIAIAAAAPLVLTDWLRLPPLVAILFTCCVAPLINYGLMGRLVFGRPFQHQAP